MMVVLISCGFEAAAAARRVCSMENKPNLTNEMLFVSIIGELPDDSSETTYSGSLGGSFLEAQTEAHLKRSFLPSIHSIHVTILPGHQHTWNLRLLGVLKLLLKSKRIYATLIHQATAV